MTMASADKTLSLGVDGRCINRAPILTMISKIQGKTMGSSHRDPSLTVSKRGIFEVLTAYNVNPVKQAKTMGLINADVTGKTWVMSALALLAQTKTAMADIVRRLVQNEKTVRIARLARVPARSA